MTNFTAAERRAHRLARRMGRDGFEPHLIYDAMIMIALSLWSAETGHKDAARKLLSLWFAIRTSAPDAS